MRMFSFEKLFAFAERLGVVETSCGDDFTKYIQIFNRRLILKRGVYTGCYRFWILKDVLAELA